MHEVSRGYAKFPRVDTGHHSSVISVAVKKRYCHQTACRFQYPTLVNVTNLLFLLPMVFGRKREVLHLPSELKFL